MGKSKKIKEKKHEKIVAKIQRLEKADTQYCYINDCAPSEYMNGKKNVYQELLEFIQTL